MSLLLFAVGAAGCSYSIEIGAECVGKDTRTVMGEFTMVWIWIVLTVLSLACLLISIIRDIVPRPVRTDISERYDTGESRNVVRFMVEEYLMTGWVVSKTQKRFSSTGRWSLIMLIIYSEIFVSALLYGNNYDDPKEFNNKDFLYGMVCTVIGFLYYLIGYYLLLLRDKDKRWRYVLGYILVTVNFILATSFLFVYTYKFHTNTDLDYTHLVNGWASCFGYSILLEFLISENIRLIARAVIIWSNKFDPDEPMHTNIELSSIERPKNSFEVDD
jgi:hypothetical protein